MARSQVAARAARDPQSRTYPFLGGNAYFPRISRRCWAASTPSRHSIPTGREAIQKPALQRLIASPALAMTRQKRSRGASASEFCSLPRSKRISPSRAKAEGGGAPKGASNQFRASQTSFRGLRNPSARGSGPMSGAVRLPALHRGACQSDRTLRLSPGRVSREGEDAGVTRTVDRA
jgi:hypothetical protein